jgi:sigma-B regulation protein RsbU (phosphoserine phosphatase)
MTTSTDTGAAIATGAADDLGIVVLLVDDQPIIGEAVRRMLASQDDIAFHYLQDPTKAVATATELRATVILQDLVMPEIDGLDLVLRYREEEATRLTPLIVLSTKEEADTKAEAFARGANDYLVKLPDPVELIARLRYHSRGYIALLERNRAYAELARSEKALNDEIAKAARYVRSLLPAPVGEAPVRSDWRFIPSVALGGDSFDYHWLDDDHLAMFLIDASGHGVGPALLSVSALNVMRSHSLAGVDFTDPSQVLNALNEAFRMDQHNNMYFTMWYGVYSPSSRELCYSGGGHPPALLVRGGAEPAMLESQGPMVGAVPMLEYDSERCRVEAGDQVYLYSDGVFEIAKTDGEMWSFAEFKSFMGEPRAG